MQIAKYVGLLGVAFAVAGAAGCTKEEPAPAFTKGSGQAPVEQPTTNKVAYPDGPYGVGKGSVIAPYEFYGFHNPQLAADPNNLEKISLAMFYNPTGTDTYPADSPYRPGEPKPKALLIDVSAFWCPPCQQESKTELPTVYPQLQPRGMEFLLELNQDLKGGPAQPSDLVKWTAQYKTHWPSVIDPTSKLGPIYESDAFPGNFLIDTKTMTIVVALAGAPTLTDTTDPVRQQIEKLLNQ
jgi:thiol-disulfide isomerase/thioredoxin